MAPRRAMDRIGFWNRRMGGWLWGNGWDDLGDGRFRCGFAARGRPGGLARVGCSTSNAPPADARYPKQASCCFVVQVVSWLCEVVTACPAPRRRPFLPRHGCGDSGEHHECTALTLGGTSGRDRQPTLRQAGQRFPASAPSPDGSGAAGAKIPRKDDAPSVAEVPVRPRLGV